MKHTTLYFALGLGAIVAIGCSGAGADGLADGSGEAEINDGSGAVEIDDGTGEVEGDDGRVREVLESLPQTLLTENVSHSQEELDAYRALLDEYGVLIDKAGGSCGSRASFWNQVSTTLVTPDHFPPDSLVGLPIAVPTAVCVLGGVAHFHKVGCNVHDRCYSTRGADRNQCDREFRSNLRRECDRAFSSFLEEPCRSACKGVAQLMYEAVDALGADAFAEAQEFPIASGAPRPPLDPVCVAECENNCLSLQFDQIGLCQVNCPDACH